MGLENFGDNLFEVFQVPVTDIEDLTGLDFGGLRANDNFDEVMEEGAELESIGARSRVRRVRSLDDVII